MKYLFEQYGGTYSTVSDYRVPNLTAPDVTEYQIGIWGQRRLDYLKHYRRVIYVNLLTSGKLARHLHETNSAAFERQEALIRQMAAAQGVTEQLKAENQMVWVDRMNNIQACVGEIVLNELIYE